MAHLARRWRAAGSTALRIVVDSANGAASEVAASVYEGLGAEVVAIGCDPDGTNINAGCGSTSTGTLASAVVEHQADLGLALDGDADRLLAVGRPTGPWSTATSCSPCSPWTWPSGASLAGNTVVVTVMTNLGFRHAMDERSIIVKETPVGDRHVLDALDKEGFSLGGEQSGHIIFRRLATTGDGSVDRPDPGRPGQAVGPLAHRPAGRPGEPGAPGAGQRAGPQHASCWTVPTAVWSAVAEEEARLGHSGRVLLRPSGTEPLVRVMVEAQGDGVAEAIAERLGKLVGFELQAAAATHG